MTESLNPTFSPTWYMVILNVQSVKTRSAWKAVRSPMTRLLLLCTPTSIMLRTAPGYTIKKEQALGQLQLVHTGFRLIFVLIPCVLLVWPHRDDTLMTSGLTMYRLQYGDDGVTLQYYKDQQAVIKVKYALFEIILFPFKPSVEVIQPAS